MYLVHEAIHLYVRQHLRPFLVLNDDFTMEDINLGHGPAFCHVCNTIGTILDLEPVNVGNDPSCVQWPVIVRPLAYYLDGAMTDPEIFKIMRIIQPLSFRLSDHLPFVSRRIVG